MGSNDRRKASSPSAFRLATSIQRCRWQVDPDGKYFIFQAQGQIWALPDREGLFGRSDGKPIQLTSSPLALASPLPSKNGKKLFVVGRTQHGALSRYDRNIGQFVPFYSGQSVEATAFSKDGLWIAYVTYPEGALWRSRLDGSERLRLTDPPLYPLNPRWSPDGKQIAFWAAQTGETDSIYTVSAEGGRRYGCFRVILSLAVSRTGHQTGTASCSRSRYRASRQCFECSI